MILITSAAYVSPALISTFGKLPPCMLPVQNRRLYQHQIQALPAQERVVISLPAGYDIPAYDAHLLKEKGVEVIFVDANLSLGQSIVYALNVLASYDEPLRLLHGDTLIATLPSKIDCIATGSVDDDYAWNFWDAEHRQAIAGYFAFSSQSLLIRSITECNGRFIEGVRRYDELQPLEVIKLEEWLDFGISNTYYRSRSLLTTQRVFNDLKITRFCVKKRSADARKILAEANWIKSLPTSLRHYAPALFDSGIDDTGRGFYEIEYFYLNSLADLFVFGRNPVFVWRSIIESCAEYIDAEHQFHPADAEKVAEQCIQLYGEKTTKRLRTYAEAQSLDLQHPWKINGESVGSLADILDDISQPLSSPQPSMMGIVHGDFCFSNILYDFISRSIRVIDPRGINAAGEQTIYGDLRYDVAKLAHSVLGMYDFIIGGNFQYEEVSPYSVRLSFPQDAVRDAVQQYFRQRTFAGYTLTQLHTYPILVHLFLSMLPLHSDHPQRQQAMLANALRLYKDYKAL